MNRPDAGAVARLAALLDRAGSVLFVTGAGLSADSGLPTYRGVGGLYDRGPTEEGLSIEEALGGATMRRRPALSWKYIHQLESTCRGAHPNRAHRVIAALEQRLDRVWVLTQNVDGLHQAAGSRQVIPIHGNLHDLVCTRCGHRDRVESYAGLEIPPSCPHCGALVRPDVVLFGEMLPRHHVLELYGQLDRGFDLVVSVGTSSLFPYIAEPVLRARWTGRPAVEINPEDTPVSGVVDLRIRAGAATTMGAAWEALTGGRRSRPGR